MALKEGDLRDIEAEMSKKVEAQMVRILFDSGMCQGMTVESVKAIALAASLLSLEVYRDFKSKS